MPCRASWHEAWTRLQQRVVPPPLSLHTHAGKMNTHFNLHAEPNTLNTPGHGHRPCLPAAFACASDPSRPLQPHRRTNRSQTTTTASRPALPPPPPLTRAHRSRCVLRRCTSPHVPCKCRILRFVSLSSAGQSAFTPAAPRSLSCVCMCVCVVLCVVLCVVCVCH